jgi:hypothetical protein
LWTVENVAVAVSEDGTLRYWNAATVFGLALTARAQDATAASAAPPGRRRTVAAVIPRASLISIRRDLR